MNIAENIIQKFGGLSATARALNHRNASTVQGWKQRGVIPARQMPKILEAAETLGIPLSAEDFFQTAPDTEEGPDQSDDEEIRESA